MLKDYNLKITDFIPNKKKGNLKNIQNFLNSILLYVYNFFENESNIKPNISRFYLPLPRINIKLVRLGGISSLQYNLYRRDVCLEFDRSEKEILKDFYSELINLDLQNSKKTRRIIALESLYKLFYISRDLDNSLKQICYKDSNNNLRFNTKFFIVFERYKKQAVLKLIEHYYERANINEFEIKFPQLKNIISRINKSEKSRLFLTFGHTGDLSYGIGFEFLRY